MKITWLSSDYDYEKIILAGDIGGTNTNLAVVGSKNGEFTIVLETVFKSSEIDGIIEPMRKTLDVAAEKGITPSLCCISAAGPVENNFCDLTNCDWNINGDEIADTFEMKTAIINDFLAISYGVLTLDINNPDQITKVPHADGTVPEPENAAKAVLGPGTGLGVSYITYHEGKYIPGSSEGGHAGFSAFDDESRAVKEFVARRYNGKNPGAEPFVSGQGFCNLFAYFKEKKGLKMDGVYAEIDNAPYEDKPYLISMAAKNGDAVCREIVDIFVRMYGSYASSLALIFLPFGGLYLAGGITSKEEKGILENNCFINAFTECYSANHEELLKKIPVYIVKDYAVSLYGAANAALHLL